MSEGIGVLKNPVQEYAWGSKTAIPELLGNAAPAETPQAELWMGAHPRASSLVLRGGRWTPLREWIETDPEGILGKRTAARFSGEMPFLFKVLAAAKPLSIQAHPDREQAREGFSRENTLGIPMRAPDRNYRDENHKPEVICALTPFWALNGFRKTGDILRLMEMIPAAGLAKETAILRDRPDAEGLRKFFSFLMTLPGERQHQVVAEAVAHAKRHCTVDPAFEWVVHLNGEYPGDMGVLSPVFLNLVQLQPGQAMFLRSGDLHAYLGGVGIELMANSDNVLRGGLTGKHIDVPELLKVVNFVEKEVAILTPQPAASGEYIYTTPAEEFILSVILVHKQHRFVSKHDRSIEILFCTEGRSVVTDSGTGDVTNVKKGTAIVVPASVWQYRIEGDATLYRASVPFTRA